MPDRFAYLPRPESHHRDPATVAAFDHFSHDVRLGKRRRQLHDIVFSPVVARAMERPHFPWPRLRIAQARVQTAPLIHTFFDGNFARAGVLIFHRAQQNVREIVVDFERQHALQIRPRKPERTRRNLHPLPQSHLPDRFVHLRLLEVEREMHIFAPDPNIIAVGGSADNRLVQRQLPPIFEQKRLHITFGRHLKLRRARRQHHRSACLHVHLDRGRLSGFRLGGRSLQRRLQRGFRQLRASRQHEGENERRAKRCTDQGNPVSGGDHE